MFSFYCLLIMIIILFSRSIDSNILCRDWIGGRELF